MRREMLSRVVCFEVKWIRYTTKVVDEQNNGPSTLSLLVITVNIGGKLTQVTERLLEYLHSRNHGFSTSATFIMQPLLSCSSPSVQFILLPTDTLELSTVANPTSVRFIPYTCNNIFTLYISVLFLCLFSQIHFQWCWSDPQVPSKRGCLESLGSRLNQFSWEMGYSVSATWKLQKPILSSVSAA